MKTEQQEIVRRVAGLFALADQIEARFQAAQSRIRRITHWRPACGFKVEL